MQTRRLWPSGAATRPSLQLTSRRLWQPTHAHCGMTQAAMRCGPTAAPLGCAQATTSLRSQTRASRARLTLLIQRHALRAPPDTALDNKQCHNLRPPDQTRLFINNIYSAITRCTACSYTYNISVGLLACRCVRVQSQRDFILSEMDCFLQKHLFRLWRWRECQASTHCFWCFKWYRGDTNSCWCEQAWYREGCAASELGLWNDAAQAFFRGYQTDPNNHELAGAFQAAVQQGKQAHAAAHAAPAHAR